MPSSLSPESTRLSSGVVSVAGVSTTRMLGPGHFVAERWGTSRHRPGSPRPAPSRARHPAGPCRGHAPPAACATAPAPPISRCPGPPCGLSRPAAPPRPARPPRGHRPRRGHADMSRYSSSPGKCLFHCHVQDPQQVLSSQVRGAFCFLDHLPDTALHESRRLGRPTIPARACHRCGVLAGTGRGSAGRRCGVVRAAVRRVRPSRGTTGAAGR